MLSCFLSSTLLGAVLRAQKPRQCHHHVASAPFPSQVGASPRTSIGCTQAAPVPEELPLPTCSGSQQSTLLAQLAPCEISVGKGCPPPMAESRVLRPVHKHCELELLSLGKGELQEDSDPFQYLKGLWESRRGALGLE